MRPAEPRWWEEFPEGQRWAGVFQGGGARGAAYAGALKAVAERDQWFQAAAGSSAGALTATLVAAGFHPSEFEALTAYLLDSIEPATRLDRALSHVPGIRALTRFDSNALEARLEALIRAGIVRHGGTPDTPLTFSALWDVVGIALYVIALDTTSGQPVVMSAECTPDLPIAPSVIASCSIPLAFEPRYLAWIHRLGWCEVGRVSA